MIRFFLLPMLVFLPLFTALAQENSQPPLILQGKIDNTSNRQLKVYIQNKPGEYLLDTIFLEENGSFYFKTHKVTVPQSITLQKGLTIHNLFVAPGYNLTIKCNGKNNRLVNETLKITGKGALSNSFRTTPLYYENDPRIYETTDYSPKKLIKYLEKSKSIQDSLYKKLYQSRLDKMKADGELDPEKKAEDPYFSHFAKLVQLNNEFTRLNSLLRYVDRNDYSYKKAINFVRDNFDEQVLDNISREEWLISYKYRRMITYYYPKYRFHLDKKKNKSLEINKEYILDKVGEIYEGTVRDFALADKIRSGITFAKTLDQLYTNRERLEPYIKNLQDTFYQELVAQKFTEKEAYLMKNQAGQPAPSFTLKDIDGDEHSLEDFKGKVVLLDFWASWCRPCRIETPELREIHKEYGDDIALISIAVRDYRDKWLKAIEKDKMDWLQLFDKKGKVDQAYHANAIPRYIIIDQQGKIADFDAPRPKNTEKLKNALEQVIAGN